ncbi:uncharacterized protein LOC111702191 [Eurytemora carolleeae]|uniref:uncharacterized protein LOC111702191 n=1 Tax=Eurytemora carolleeae TaxID=1294199 RepID=UPI000C77D355|nr:uncharacterized protein LOC111702191 [Eurytemora carolleeae]|eukprot:XP_023329955.1 uncharacterized protein LOC111702191 [Eurytemora affinis]
MMFRVATIILLLNLAGFIHPAYGGAQSISEPHAQSLSQTGRSLKPTQAENEEFFEMIEHLLWITDEKEGAGRMYYRRPSAGWMGMRRPRFLSERNGEPSSLYRKVLEECNGWLCALGINGLVYKIGRMLA